jgi:hypothetical protein
MKWSDRHVHVVSFDVPWPPDYGGVIDVFYKLKALAAAGCRLHLHCFQYGRQRAERLADLCETVHYYQRNVSKAQLFHRLPYIVISRADPSLLRRLRADEHPVLFEGLHSCHFLPDAALAARVRIVRAHNIEHEYYRSLAQVESNIFKRYYYHNEAAKLEEFEGVLRRASRVAAISRNDEAWFASRYGNAFYLPAFHAYEKVQIRPGTGDFAFYHGNLAVGENNQAALFLVNRVFRDLPYKLVVAGQKPSRELQEAVARRPNTSLVPDPGHARVLQLVSDAQVNVLPTFQPTGIKLKLLTALFNGRHCLANGLMVRNTGLESECTVADAEQDFRDRLRELFDVPFEAGRIRRREEVLLAQFSNAANAEKLLMRLFP